MATNRTLLPRAKRQNAVAVIAALLGIGFTSWVTHTWSLRAEPAVAVYVLVGFPTYNLIVIGCTWANRIRRFGRKA